MNIGQLAVAAGLVAALMGAPAALAQPETKLTRNLSQATINAIWCSALFLEESYYWDEDSDEAAHYEDIAYDLGADLDVVMGEMGLPTAESEEVWVIFDEAAATYAAEDEEGFLAKLEACEMAYTDNKLKLR